MHEGPTTEIKKYITLEVSVWEEDTVNASLMPNTAISPVDKLPQKQLSTFYYPYAFEAVTNVIDKKRYLSLTLRE